MVIGPQSKLNHHFREAPAQVREDVLAWLKSGRRARKACERLDQWIAQLDERLSRTAPRRPRVTPGGEHHDLEELLADVLASELDLDLGSKGVPAITWGRRGRRPARRSLQLGSYDPDLHLVRVNRVLDQPAVPSFFVRYVVFHELLHAALGDERSAGGRRAHHGPRFRAREAAFSDYERALVWQEAHVTKLLRSLRTGVPMRPVHPVRPVREAERTQDDGPAWPVRLIQRLLFPTEEQPAPDAASNQLAETGR